MKLLKCNLCNSSKLIKVIDLGYHPCADTFLSNFSKNHFSEKTYPLRVGLCENCGHAQLMSAVSAQERYKEIEYSYDSSNSIISIEHFKEMAHQVSNLANLTKFDLVCDIGSNIGTLLQCFKRYVGCNIIGIDPSPNISKLANEKKVPTINDFFNMSSYKKIKKYSLPKVLTATNVLNHTEDIKTFFNLAKKLIDNDGFIVIEVPYFLELLKHKAFDTIYLEHVNYFSVKPLSSYLSSIGMSISKIELKEYMCGSLRIYIKKGGKMCKDVFDFINEEKKYGIKDREVYLEFMKNIKKIKFNLNNKLYKIKSQGGIIFGIGAATKGNTLLNYCNINSDLIDFICDTSKLKIGKFTPGSHIKIIHDKHIPKNMTHGLILPSNIAEYLKKKYSYLNIKFITPTI